MSAKTNNQGSTLIEILVVAFILTVSLVALVSLTTMSIARNRLAKERAVATRLAQEGMDWVMEQRNILGFGGMGISQSGTYCISDLISFNNITIGLCDETDKIIDLYNRELIIDDVKPTFMDYSVRVYWADNKEIVLTGSVTKWDKTK